MRYRGGWVGNDRVKKYHNDVVKSEETSVRIMAVDVNGRVVSWGCVVAVKRKKGALLEEDARARTIVDPIDALYIDTCTTHRMTRVHRTSRSWGTLINKLIAQRTLRTPTTGYPNWYHPPPIFHHLSPLHSRPSLAI